MSTLFLFIRSFFTARYMLAGSSVGGGGDSGPSGAAWVTLVAAIASWTIFPLLGALVGIFVGRSELKAIEQGRSPQSGELITRLGYYACIANVVLTVVTGCVTAAFFVAVWAGIIGSIGGLAILSELANQLP